MDHLTDLAPGVVEPSGDPTTVRVIRRTWPLAVEAAGIGPWPVVGDRLKTWGDLGTAIPHEVNNLLLRAWPSGVVDE